MLSWFLQMTFSSVRPYLLHAMTVSGVAYLIRLENISNYVSSSRLQSDDFVEFNTLTHPHQGATTAVAGIAELMVVGRSDGSVGCFQLGILDHRAPGPCTFSLQFSFYVFWMCFGYGTFAFWLYFMFWNMDSLVLLSCYYSYFNIGVAARCFTFYDLVALTLWSHLFSPVHADTL